jgi:hypothetical protein
MQWHLTLPYWLTALNASVGLVFAWLLPDTRASEERVRLNIFNLFSILMKNPYLLLLMLQGVALFVLARICQVNLFQPILQNKGFSVMTYGLMMSLMTVFEALGSLKSKWVRSYLNDLYAIFVFTFLIGISFLLLSLERLWGIDIKIVTIVALCFFSYIIGISFPIQRQLINQAIPEPKLRATLLSSESIIDRAMNSLVANSLGVALASGHLLLFLRQSAAVSIASVFIIALMIKFVGKPNNETSLS